MGIRLVHHRVRALIEDRGLRYDRVAFKVGVTPDRLNHILAGRRPVPQPTVEFYAKLARALACTAEDLYEPEEIAA